MVHRQGQADPSDGVSHRLSLAGDGRCLARPFCSGVTRPSRFRSAINSPFNLPTPCCQRSARPFVVPSLDLVFVRLCEGEKFPKTFKEELVKRVLAAVEK